MRPNNNPLNFGTIAAPALSPPAGNSQSSIAQWAIDIVRATFQVVTTGNAAGTLQIQGSDDQAFGLPPNQFQPSNWSNIGTSTAVTVAGTYLVGDVFKTSTIPLECSYEYLRLNFTATATGAQTIMPIADTGVRQHQTVTTVADVAGSLNSKYFLLSSIDAVTKARKDFYLWLDDGTGVDPAIAGRTAIHVTYTDADTAATIATDIRAALNALTNDFVATGAGAAVIITNVAPGPVPAAVDGAAPTGFTFGSATLGVASNLNNTYFFLQDEASVHSYYVWMNVDSIGTDPMIAGRTGVEIDFASGATAATIGADLATAIAALNSTNSFTAAGTTTVTVTNKTAGPFVPMSDAGMTGFTFAVTTGSGTISGRMKSMAL